MRRPARSLVAGVVFVLLAVPAAGASQGPAAPRGGPVGGELRISPAGAVNSEDSAVVASNGAGEYLVVWRDFRSVETRGLDIYGRRVSAAGLMLGGAFRISGPGAVADEQFPAVAWNAAAGEYLVVWSDLRSGTSAYGRRVSAEGAVVGLDFRINGPNAAVGISSGPAVACHDSADQCLVVWQDARNYGSRRFDVYGRRVASSGVVGWDTRITGYAGLSDEWYPAVAFSGTAGKYLVVWDDTRHSATTGRPEIYGRRVAASGALVGGDFQVSRPGGAYAHHPAVAANGAAGEYLVVWRDGRNEATRGADIFGRRVSAAGWPLEGAFLVSGSGALADESQAAVAWSQTAGEYGVVWVDERDFFNRGADIYGRLVSAAGVATGEDLRICGPNALSSEGDPAVAVDGTTGEFLVVWADMRDPATRGSDIFGRRVAG